MNRVEVRAVPEPPISVYPLGTLIEIEDSGGCNGGIYILAAAGDGVAAVLVNLAFGSSRCGQLAQEAKSCGVTSEELRANIGLHTKFRVVKYVIIAAKE